MAADEARRLAQSGRVGHLATVGEAGAPHLVPICFAVHDDKVFSAIDSKPKRSEVLRRLVNLGANPWCSVMVDHYSEDWRELWWVRADGRGRILSSGDASSAEERAGAIGLLRAKYPQYARHPAGVAHPLDGAVIAIDVSRWAGWRASGATIPQWPGSPPMGRGAR